MKCSLLESAGFLEGVRGKVMNKLGELNLIEKKSCSLVRNELKREYRPFDTKWCTGECHVIEKESTSMIRLGILVTL